MHNIWKGKKVWLRGFRAEDAEVLVSLPWDTEADALGDMTHLPTNRTPEREREFVGWAIGLSNSDASDDCKLAVMTVEGDQWVGSVGLHNSNRRMRWAELDVFIAPASAYGKGFGGEAILILLNYAFNELDYQKIELGVYDLNTRAVALYQRLGFVEEGRLRRRFLYKGTYHAEIKMGLLREEFLAQHDEFVDFLYSEH